MTITSGVGFPGTSLVLYVVRLEDGDQASIVGGPYSSLTGEAEAHEAARELKARHPEHEYEVLAMAEIEARA